MQTDWFILMKGYVVSVIINHLSCDVSRNEFYQVFYGVFDNQFAAMDALLNGKESYALQVLLIIKMWGS